MYDICISSTRAVLPSRKLGAAIPTSMPSSSNMFQHKRIFSQMSVHASRRTGASLFAYLTSPPCSIPRQACRQATGLTQRRTISSASPRWQQASAPASSTTTSSAPKPAPRTPTPQTAASKVASAENPLTPSQPIQSLTDGLTDPPPILGENEKQVDWARSFHGLSSTPFTAEQSAILQQEINADDVEVKPDGIIYLPEIKYRRILNKVFGPGGWGLAPRGETIVTGKLVTREYGLVCSGRLVSIARGEQQYFDPDGIPTATEGCKSNALMRCCKDLGIASELWDPRFIRTFMREHAKELMVEHMVTKKRRKHFMRKDDVLKYPFKEVAAPGQSSGGTAARR